MGETEMLEWTKTIGELVLSWPTLFLVFMVLFRQDLRNILGETSALSAGSFSLTRQVRALTRERQQLWNELEALKLLVAGYLTKWEVDHLNKLQSDKEFTCVIGEWTTETFFRPQIANLLGREFIEYIEGSGDLFAQGEPKVRNVKKYFRITDRGREYLKLREEMFPRSQSQTDETDKSK